ncbi:MAG: serine/threonine protein kinase, partial [Myxococcales bacterium]|nr:serine/threonine protein kinase [Myxococcales bacterium]
MTSRPGSPSRATSRDALVIGDTIAQRAAPVDADARLGVDAVEQALLFQRAASRLFGGAQEEVRVGRFVVERRLGAGAMGVVYLARDPELDRAVAIKHLHPRVDEADAAGQGQRRMRREARVMARLNHANVVNIHEVGVDDGRVFLAMEYVDGVTLSDWLAADERGWRAILSMFLQAGDGLAAAHAADVVHRDFKPDNVLVSGAGQVKVTDFGLASEAGWGAAELGRSSEFGLTTLDDARAGRSTGASTTLTRTGALLGTPRYMSPEQFLGRPADARSDQFSFCVALYEALYGVRPFAGEGLSALADAVLAGRLRARPRGGDVPSWIVDVVERGLARAPERRWPSMDAL